MDCRYKGQCTLGRSSRMNILDLTEPVRRFIRKNEKMSFNPLKQGAEIWVWEEKRFRSVSRSTSISHSLPERVNPLIPKANYSFVKTRSISVADKPTSSTARQTTDDIKDPNGDEFFKMLPKNSQSFSSRDPYGSSRKYIPVSKIYPITLSFDAHEEISENIRSRILSTEERKELSMKPIDTTKIEAIKTSTAKGCSPKKNTMNNQSSRIDTARKSCWDRRESEGSDDDACNESVSFNFDDNSNETSQTKHSPPITFHLNIKHDTNHPN